MWLGLTALESPRMLGYFGLFVWFLFILFLAALGSQLQHVGSFVSARELFVAVRGLLSSCGVWASL